MDRQGRYGTGGKAWTGVVRSGGARQVGNGVVWRVMDSFGMAGKVSNGKAWNETARQDWRGMEWIGAQRIGLQPQLGNGQKPFPFSC